MAPWTRRTSAPAQKWRPATIPQVHSALRMAHRAPKIPNVATRATKAHAYTFATGYAAPETISTEVRPSSNSPTTTKTDLAGNGSAGSEISRKVLRSRPLNRRTNPAMR